jgi:uncharacterized damage-inducible protein DinB
MPLKQVILSNLISVRRRSLLLWKGLPEKYYHWKPDENAMSAIQHIRHVLEADYGWNKIIKQEDMSNYHTPWEGVPLKSVEEELRFAAPYRAEFLQTIENFSDTALTKVQLIHPGNQEKKLLADYLLRIAYHEAVHAGQFLSYLRSMGLERPFIWD